ncbi:hypothetical protein BDV96DRAFT_96608 [Lophiotrema nucula]|uniref:Fungal-specific transcription factor domain-containing protein n=1 Tax=Lophiotrema nucula TaxID=690887 RepID=A0A6A5Z4K2_9PLEO|nr:hypothetical protein BDV96DRAFT_96608 [Lophiotrema nucula]
MKMPPPISYHFVSSSGCVKIKDEETRKLVRENAMRAFRKRERLARVQEYQQTQAKARESYKDAEASHDLGWSKSHQEALSTGQSSAIDLIREPGHTFDPFASTVLPERHRGPQLFWHFANELAPKLQPTGKTFNSVNAYFTLFALSDSGLLSTILFHSGLHLDSFLDKTDQSWSRETLHHRGESIKEMSSRLAYEDAAVSDASIAAVGFLSASINITGNVMAESPHRNALQRMIQMRGGLDQLGQSGTLAMLMTVSDIISSTIAGTAPMLPPPDISRNHLLSIGDGLSIPSCLNPGPLLPSTPSEYKTELDTIMTYTNQVLDVQTILLSSYTTTVRDMTAFTQLSSTIEHRLLCLPTTAPDAEVDGDIIINEVTKVALQIICAYTFRGFRPPTPSFSALSCRLQWLWELLGDCAGYLGTAWSIEKKMLLLWIHVAGALAATPRELDTPIVRIVNSMQQLGLRTWEEAKAVLDRFVWCVRCEDEGCQRLWLRVQALLVSSS